MLRTDKIYYSYNDVKIKPSVTTDTEHRIEGNPYIEGNKLPIFASPMSTVVNEENFTLFEENGITPILPRNIKFETRLKYALEGKWVAFSLREFEENFCNDTKEYKDSTEIKVLIDVANGHMQKIFDLVAIAKAIYGKQLVIMMGNIANPETYKMCVANDVDYVRCGIGSGSGCITTSNVGIHMPMASLIDEIAKIKMSLVSADDDEDVTFTKIIADGGIRNYDDVNKALALGADYVMIGGLFASCLESAAPLTRFGGYESDMDGNWDKISFIEGKTFFGDKQILPLFKTFYGMASKDGQKAISGTATKTAEGIKKPIEVKYNLKQWVDNMTDYLRSAMSYTNSKTLDDLKKAEVILVSNNTYNSVNK